MDGRVEGLEATVEEFRGRFVRIDQRFDAIDQKFIDLEDRLTTKITVQVEHLEGVVRTFADNIGGALAAIDRNVDDFRVEMREQTRMLNEIVANHDRRIVKLEQRRRN